MKLCNKKEVLLKYIIHTIFIGAWEGIIVQFVHIGVKYQSRKGRMHKKQEKKFDVLADWMDKMYRKNE